VYSEVVWPPTYPGFVLSEEDKTTATALEHWFHCLDWDGDGYLSPDDLYHFYEEQMYRMEYTVFESIPFEEALVQMCVATLQITKPSLSLHFPFLPFPFPFPFLSFSFLSLPFPSRRLIFILVLC